MALATADDRAADAVTSPPISR